MNSYIRKAGLAVMLLGGLAAAGCGSHAGGAGAEAAEISMKPGALRQVVAADNAEGRTVMWQMEERTDAFVEYRETGREEVQRTAASVQFLKGNQGEDDRYIYEARLSGLTPGASYEYRTRAGRAASEWHTMRTDDGGPFTALIFPDSQSSDYGVWKSTADAGRLQAPDAAFFINMGDLVDNGQDEYQWQSWFSAAEPMISEIPAAPLMGNHEAYSLDWKMAKPERFLAHFALPENGDGDFPEEFYSFDWGDVHFTVLNTQMEEMKAWHPDLLARELAWLRDDLARTEKPWKVVLMHKDPLQYRIASRPERQEGFSPEGTAFMPVFDEMGVDAVISAHLHTYRNRGRIYDFRRDVKGPLYILSGVAGDVRYPNLWTDHAMDVTVAPQPETDNFMTMEAGKDRLVFRAFLTDGTLIDEAEVHKP